MERKNWLVKTGDFFFKYRNGIFPAVMLGLFLLQPPAQRFKSCAGDSARFRKCSPTAMPIPSGTPTG